jgi:hypothetical protein
MRCDGIPSRYDARVEPDTNQGEDLTDARISRNDGAGAKHPFRCWHSAAIRPHILTIFPVLPVKGWRMSGLVGGQSKKS